MQREKHTTRGRNADRERINVNEEYEAGYWSKKLGVSRDDLRNAVKRVGVMARNVAAFFKTRGGRSRKAA